MSDFSGKHGLIVGVANRRSISWGIAQAMHAAGARLALTYPTVRLEDNVRELAEKLDNPLVMPCDVSSDDQIAELVASIDREFGGLDFLVHGASFAPAHELSAPFAQTTREGFRIALDISAYSLIGLTRACLPLFEKRGGGSVLTLTFLGSDRVFPNYNVMGPVKAALEASCRYLAYELGPRGIRVHAISPGPLKTRASSGIKDFELLLNEAAEKAPLGELVDIMDVGFTCAYLATTLAKRITGGTVYVDGGANIIA